MSDEIEFWWTCDNCGHEVIINEGEEFNNYSNEPCGFCQNGHYGKCTIVKVGKQISEFE